MNRRFLSFSLLGLGLVISGCSVVPTNGALGSFEYAKKTEGEPLVIPENLSKPKQNKKFDITEVNSKGKMDIELRIGIGKGYVPSGFCIGSYLV